MKNIEKRLSERNWQNIARELHDQGFVVVRNVLDKEECDALIAGYDVNDTYRKTMDMERYRFGSGAYKYFRYPLPQFISDLREQLYPRIVPVANLFLPPISPGKRDERLLPRGHETWCRNGTQRRAAYTERYFS